MLNKILLGACAAGLLAAATAAPAAAKVHFSLNVGVPGYVYEPYPVYPAYHPYPVYPAYDAGYDEYDDGEDCGYEFVKVKRWNRHHDSYRIVRREVWVCH